MIKLAAIRKDGIIYTGTRHGYIMHNPERPLGYLFNGEQGFITDTDEFVDRIAGARIAYECGQIVKQQDELYSEDIIEADEEEKRIYNGFVNQMNQSK
ncbi:MAG TPA: hypothetical protein VIK86_04695 [Candidatus Paceibacterota bacterium]